MNANVKKYAPYAGIVGLGVVGYFASKKFVKAGAKMRTVKVVAVVALFGVAGYFIADQAVKMSTPKTA